ncbi:MAG: hypothetical protein ACM3MK_06405 [Chitinophagales bacterium]
MDDRSLIQQVLQKCQTSASDIRQAATQTTNAQAKSVLSSAASSLEGSIRQMQSIISQL